MVIKLGLVDLYVEGNRIGSDTSDGVIFGFLVGSILGSGLMVAAVLLVNAAFGH